MKKMFVTVDNDVRTASIGIDVHSQAMRLVPLGLVCRCIDSESAFLIAATLNNLVIGCFWEGWNRMTLPWTTDESNEFIYDANGVVVTRITNEASQLIDTRDFCTNEDRKSKTYDRKAKLLLNMLNAMYNESEPYRNMFPEESKQSIPAQNARKQLTDDEIAWAICQVFENIPPIYRVDKLTKHVNREMPRLRNQLMDIHLGNYVHVENINYVARWSHLPATIYTLKISDGCGWYQLVELQFTTPSANSKSEFFLSNIETWNAEGNKRNIWSA